MITHNNIVDAIKILDAIENTLRERMGYPHLQDDEQRHSNTEVLRVLEVLALMTSGASTDRLVDEQMEVMKSARENAQAYKAYVDELRVRMAAAERGERKPS